MTPFAYAKEWAEVYPERFAEVEQFFLAQGCRFYQNSSYIYNLRDEVWLDYKSAAQVFPSLSADLSENACDIEITKQELERLLNTSELPSTGYALLYFDLPRDKENPLRDIRRILSDEMRMNYEQRLQRLDSFTGAKKYKVITSTKGLKPL